MTDTTKLTEIVTGLGMLGGDHPLEQLPIRPGELRNVDDSVWDVVVAGWSDPSTRPLVDAAFDNGRYFLAATDALRGRRPRLVEWTGPTRPPGDEVAPVDLRVDHVYLVSCKYLSKITMNASPAHLFDRLLTGGHGRRGADWYRDVAPDAYAALWEASRSWLASERPATQPPADLDALEQRRADARRLISAGLRHDADPRQWPSDLAAVYREFSAAVAVRSARRWQASIDDAPANAAEAMLWRLLRIGSAPYFVLGAGHRAAVSTRGSRAGRSAEPLRLRVGSPWDVRQHFTFRRLRIAERGGGQPMVSWHADLTDRRGRPVLVEGHVEIRWSHGRFGGPPEAKVYLDTPFGEVPGYWPLT